MKRYLGLKYFQCYSWLLGRSMFCKLIIRLWRWRLPLNRVNAQEWAAAAH